MLPNTYENHSYHNDENERVETIDQQRELTVKQVVVRGGRKLRSNTPAVLADVSRFTRVADGGSCSHGTGG